MAKKKLDKSQRHAYARVLQYAAFAMGHVCHLLEKHPYFEEALTDREWEELKRLKTLIHKLGLKCRTYAWKLDGFDDIHGPPRPIGDFKVRKKGRRRAA